MKIKLVKSVKFVQKELPEESILEVSDKVAKHLIESKEAVEYTDQLKAIELDKIKIEVKKMTTEVIVEKSVQAPNIIVKQEPMLKQIAKAMIHLKKGDEIVIKATGASEGTAADGGNLVYQLPDELAAKLIPCATVFNDCSKQTDFPDGVYGRPIPYKNVSTLSPTSEPRSYQPGEGAAVTVTKLVYGLHDLKLGSDKIYTAITHELLSDVGYFENDVIADLIGRLYYNRENAIMTSAYSAGVNGCIGITHAGAANFLCTPVAHAATYTGTIVNKIISGVDSRLRDGAKWYMSNSTWATLVGQLGTGTTVSTQPLFSNNNMTLAGYPIVIVPSMATFGSVNDILFANLAEGYTVGQKGDIVFKVSDDYLFNTDEKAYMAVLRYQGAPTNRKVTQVDGIAVGALSTTSGK